MQSRQDPTGTYRLLERDLEVRQLLLVIFSALTERKPTLAVINVTPHDHVLAAIQGALEWLSIPVLFFQPSLVGPQSLPRLSLTKNFEYEVPESIRDRYSEELAEIVSLSRASIERLENGGGTEKLSFQKQRETSARSLLGRLRSLTLMPLQLAKGIGVPSVNFSGHTTLPRWFLRSLEVILGWSLRRSLVSSIYELESEIPRTVGKFALFALHYEPERCSIPEGFPFNLQLDAVVRARALLPQDTVLVVKEHFSQSAAAMRGASGRSPDTYAMLESIPGVKMLGIHANTPELITRAECVFTLTGKVGIEAALKGTPVIFGGQPWWSAMPGSASMSQFSNAAELEKFLGEQRPSRVEVFDWLTCEFTHTLVPILGDATVERYTERISPLPGRFNLLQLEVLVDIIQQFGKRMRSSKT
jgi:hypothetical protein